MARQWWMVDGEAIADALGMLLGFVVSNLNWGWRDGLFGSGSASAAMCFYNPPTHKVSLFNWFTNFCDKGYCTI